jgi:hypothetical protein
MMGNGPLSMGTIVCRNDRENGGFTTISYHKLAHMGSGPVSFKNVYVGTTTSVLRCGICHRCPMVSRSFSHTNRIHLRDNAATDAVRPDDHHENLALCGRLFTFRRIRMMSNRS